MAEDKLAPQAQSAVDQTEKRRQMARDLITQARQLMAAIERGETLSTEYENTGYTFIDTDFQGQPGLTHVNSQMMIDSISNFISLKAYLRTNFIDTIFLQIRQ